jgi:Rps23 Pro-64 3,4-dihydroxylase Tpa1-like proline 4-hydroxylase
MNIGLHEKEKQNTPIHLYEEVMPVGEMLSDTSVGRKKLISSNMVAASEYLNVLKTDVNKLLDSATDRESMLESFLDQLKYRYTSTSSYLSILSAQMTELQRTVTTSDQSIETIKSAMTSAYKNLDYDKTEELLNSYLAEKQKNTYARTYLVFLGKFVSTYQTLNAYNKTMLDTLINNREALIKNVTVVLPDSGTSLMKQLNLVKTEAEWKARE